MDMGCASPLAGSIHELRGSRLGLTFAIFFVGWVECDFLVKKMTKEARNQRVFSSNGD